MFLTLLLLFTKPTSKAFNLLVKNKLRDCVWVSYNKADNSICLVTGKAFVFPRGADSQCSLKDTELNTVREHALFCAIHY